MGTSSIHCSAAENSVMTSEQHQSEERLQSADIYREIELLSQRDLQLWSICALVIVVIGIGFAAFMLPNMVWASLVLHTDHRFLPQLFFGLITLIVLFNVYILDQKRHLNRTRGEMLRHLVESTQAKQVAIIDPLTGAFNRRYLDELIPREVSRAARASSDLSLLVIDVDNFKEVNTALGHFGGDQYLRDLAALLKKTFRGSDTVLRLGGDEFLIVLPETGSAQAHRAAERLKWEANWWNQATEASYRISFSCGVATYQQGMDIQDVLRLADIDMYRSKRERKAAPAPSATPASEAPSRRLYAVGGGSEA